MKRTTLYLTLALAVTIVLESCKSNSTSVSGNNFENESQSSIDFLVVTTEIDFIRFLLLQKLSRNDTNATLPLVPCADILFNPGPVFDRYEITFYTNCSYFDGRDRRGTIVADVYGDIFSPGGYFEIRPRDYKVNAVSFTGFKIRTHFAGINGTNPIFIDTLKEVMVKPAKGVINLDLFQSIEWVNGYTTVGTQTDDQFAIQLDSGQLKARSTLPLSCFSNPTSLYSFSCGVPQIVNGGHRLRVKESPTRRISYGDTTMICDDIATLEIDSYSGTLYLKRLE